MWDYVAFLAINVAALLVALIAWRLREKEIPWDETTIPGLKPTWEAVKDRQRLPQRADDGLGDSPGNLDALRSAASWAAFASEQGRLFGPLSSFYWAHRYVVLLQEDLANLPDGARLFLDPLGALAPPKTLQDQDSGQGVSEALDFATDLVERSKSSGRVTSALSGRCEVVRCVGLALRRDARLSSGPSPVPPGGNGDWLLGLLLGALQRHRDGELAGWPEAQRWLVGQTDLLGLLCPRPVDLRGYLVPAGVPVLLYSKQLSPTVKRRLGLEELESLLRKAFETLA